MVMLGGNKRMRREALVMFGPACPHRPASSAPGAGIDDRFDTFVPSYHHYAWANALLSLFVNSVSLCEEYSPGASAGLGCPARKWTVAVVVRLAWGDVGRSTGVNFDTTCNISPSLRPFQLLVEGPSPGPLDTSNLLFALSSSIVFRVSLTGSRWNFEFVGACAAEWPSNLAGTSMYTREHDHLPFRTPHSVGVLLHRDSQTSCPLHFSPPLLSSLDPLIATLHDSPSSHCKGNTTTLSDRSEASSTDQITRPWATMGASWLSLSFRVMGVWFDSLASLMSLCLRTDVGPVFVHPLCITTLHILVYFELFVATLNTIDGAAEWSSMLTFEPSVWTSFDLYEFPAHYSNWDAPSLNLIDGETETFGVSGGSPEVLLVPHISPYLDPESSLQTVRIGLGIDRVREVGQPGFELVSAILEHPALPRVHDFGDTYDLVEYQQ
ncbi:hypothetical protein DFP72DRAFT_1054634 [Ephemerocybe angulata]|uniref:Uncharacterized protein n=1 Tax=Ephemerocybe angulata TaxID=980116 RepID=A0A8H6H7C7_9AGAR|nr:hypothetical protein DFP72DRAFT_1054634 [Tulosesus angulatus]